MSMEVLIADMQQELMILQLKKILQQKVIILLIV